MADWLFWVLLFIGEIVLIFAISYTIFNYPKNDAPSAIIPEGWKIQRRGVFGVRGFDARTPEGKWLGWTYRKKSWAVDHAWTVARFEEEIKVYSDRFDETLKKIEKRHRK